MSFITALALTVCGIHAKPLNILFFTADDMNHDSSAVHQLSSKAYAGFGSISNILVLVGGLIVPEVKRRLGWRGAILGVQGIAVALLVVMGLTELVRSAAWALPLAIGCFILRQITKAAAQNPQPANHFGRDARLHGTRGNFEKSGGRFSRNACFPSRPSSLM